MQTQSSDRLSQHEYAARTFGSSIGNLFLGFFGMAWLVLGLVAMQRIAPPLLAFLVVFLAILAAASIYIMRRTHGLLDRSEAGKARRKRINRRFGLVNALQWSLIFAAIYGLPHVGRSGWILPAIILIIGVHFFPLASLFRAPVHYVTGSAIVVWAILYPVLFSVGKGDPAGAVGMGAILWASAAYTAWRAFRLLRRMPAAGPRVGTVPNGAHA